MRTRFNYSVDALDKKTLGRTTPSIIEDATEQWREEKGGVTIPAIAIRYAPPDGALELQVYEGGRDCIPSTSDLGRLITAFSRLGVDDISANDFSAILKRYVFITVSPMRNGAGVSYKRFPIRWLSDEEVGQYFAEPLASLAPYIAEIEAILTGVPVGMALLKLASHEWAKPMITDIDAAIGSGDLQAWLSRHSHLVINNNTFIYKENGNGK